MIVLASEEFAIGLKLAGIKNSHKIDRREDAEALLEGKGKEIFIITTESIFEMVPMISEFLNVVVFPDKIVDFSNIEDLKRIARNAIGAEVDI